MGDVPDVSATEAWGRLHGKFPGTRALVWILPPPIRNRIASGDCG